MKTTTKATKKTTQTTRLVWRVRGLLEEHIGDLDAAFADNEVEAIAAFVTRGFDAWSAYLIWLDVPDCRVRC